MIIWLNCRRSVYTYTRGYRHSSFYKMTQLICIANYSLLCLDTNNLGLHNVIVSVWFQNGVYKHVCFCMLTSRACCILSFWAMFGREEQKLVLFSKICPPNRLSSGKRVSLHRRQMPSVQDVSNTLQTEPLRHTHTMRNTHKQGWNSQCELRVGGKNKISAVFSCTAKSTLLRQKTLQIWGWSQNWMRNT